MTLTYFSHTEMDVAHSFKIMEQTYDPTWCKTQKTSSLKCNQILSVQEMCENI